MVVSSGICTTQIFIHCVNLGVKLLGAYGISEFSIYTTVMLLFLRYCLSVYRY